MTQYPPTRFEPVTFPDAAPYFLSGRATPRKTGKAEA
jgi:hypothetical protein